MADKFVWSGATGANDGSSWGDAYTTLMKDWGAEADFTPGTDFVYVRSTHSESNGATVTLTGTTAEGAEAPVRILCVTGNDTGTDPGTLTTGAQVSTNDTTYDMYLYKKFYVYGVKFLSNDDIYIGSSSADNLLIFEACRIELTGIAVGDRIYISGSYGSECILLDSVIDFGSTSQKLQIMQSMQLKLINTSCEAAMIILVGPNYNFSNLEFVACDLSVITGSLINAADFNYGCRYLFSRCKFNSGVTLVNGTIDVPRVVIDFHYCQSGTDSDPAYQMKRYTYQGTVETDTARYRTGGASDGERTNPYSWSMDTSAGSNVIELYEPLESPPIAAWTDGDGSTAHTYRIYVASGATLQNDECWVELIGPNSSDTSSLGERNTTRPAPLATPANLTTDSGSTWNGTDVTTKQYIEITYTPDKPGPIEARVYLAKPSERVSVDPKIYIDPS